MRSNRNWQKSEVKQLMARSFQARWLGSTFLPHNLLFRNPFTAYDRTDVMAQTLEDNLFDTRPLGLPLVYDVHHHRCHGDDLDVEAATSLALETWDREPLFHVSSPRDGWRADNPRSHSDYIDVRDFPTIWDGMDITVEVEAKAKELAVLKLKKALERRARRKAAQR
jgi:UV DNA damage repair endonuclease